MEKNTDNKPDNPIDNLSNRKFFLAVIVLIVYLIFIVYLVNKTTINDDLVWTRLLYLFTGIEAIVFAALGYVFGRDINRIRAENAEKDAERAKEKGEKAKANEEKAKIESQKEREKGIAISTAIKAINSHQANMMFENLSTKSVRGNDVNGVNFLTKLTNKLYPTLDDYVTISFDYEITPTDNFNSITINKITKNKSKETFSGVPIFDNRFTVDIDRKDDKKYWTIKITKIWDSNGIERKQLNGKTESNYDSAYVQLENL